MRGIALELAYLTCVMYGWEVQTSAVELPNRTWVKRRELQEVKTLVTLLLTLDPAAVFNPSGSRAFINICSPGVAVSQPVARRHIALQMADPKADLSVKKTLHPQPQRRQNVLKWLSWMRLKIWWWIRRRIKKDKKLAPLAGKPDIVPELQSRTGSGASPAFFLPSAFPFPLDTFQLKALRALHEGRSIVVSAPTGSGKTVCGELGCYLALARGQRIIYTTPLKALSNQKFFDLQRQLGNERVGLLTGDTTINRNAPVLVMTTEIYRLMLLRRRPDADTDKQQQESSPVGDEDSDPLSGVKYAILDEFHYMNDNERGTVWEESCILTPPAVQLIALSATLTNADEITSWLEAIHGPTTLIDCDYRPVPLRYHFADNLGIIPLFSTENAGPGGEANAPGTVQERRELWKLNKELENTEEEELRQELDKILNSIPEFGRSSGISSSRGRGNGAGRGRGTVEENADAVGLGWTGMASRASKAATVATGPVKRMLARELSARKSESPSSGKSEVQGSSATSEETATKYRYAPTMNELARMLKQQNMVPAIVFIFSRQGCDQAAALVASTNNKLISKHEMLEIMDRVRAFRDANPDLPVDEQRFRWLQRGVASHHAGLLPIEKSFIESLFQEALIKIVFATETLAAGINMPARCTVLTIISKRDRNQQVPLSSSAVLQMAGRAAVG